VEPTAVRIGLMDSRRPGLVEWLPARHLTPMQRAWRALKRGFVVGGTSLVVTNLLVLFVPIPWLHFCTVPFAILAGPLMAVLTVRERALLGACVVKCPRCRETVEVPKDFPGWPARKNCLACGIMVQLDLAEPDQGTAARGPVTGPTRDSRVT
jgi:hypothetical protein